MQAATLHNKEDHTMNATTIGGVSQIGRGSTLLRAGALAALCIGLGAMTARASTVYWDGGGADNRVITKENWTTDTQPTGGILGIIDNTYVVNPSVTAGATAGGNVTGYTVEQRTGSFTPTGNITLAQGTVWTLKGGNITTPNNIFTLNASSLIIDGGTFSSASRRFEATGNTLLEVKSGSFSNGDVGLRTANATTAFDVKVSGGSLTSTRLNFHAGGPAHFTVTGGTVNFTSATTASTLGSGMTFGLGEGSVTFAVAPTVSGTSAINFVKGSGGSLTVTGYGQSDYEAWWTAGSLKFDGANDGSFSDHFEVTGATLTLKPQSTGTVIAIR